MGTLNDATEIGDGSSYVSSMKKDGSKKNYRRTWKEPSRSPDAISGSAFTGEFNAEMKLRKSNDNDDVTALPLESCGFPYYRSYRNGRSLDAVLVKDIGVSCTLLNERSSSGDSSKDSSVESYLVKCLKTEYNDLSEITKKISTYTTDIIRNLILRERKREELRSKRAMATHREIDEGKPCLKMRLKNEVRCLYRQDVANGVDPSKVSIDERKDFFNDDIEANRATMEEKQQRVSKDRKSLQEFSTYERSCSSSDSSSIVYNYLMMGNKSTTYGRKLIDNKTNRRLYQEFDKIVNNEENVESPRTIVLTNWEEISRAKLRKNMSTSKIFRHTINEKLQRRSRRSYRPESVEKLTDGSTQTSVNGFLQDTNFHNFNVRILKHNRK